jgi:lysophospholipase L1-like esterase
MPQGYVPRLIGVVFGFGYANLEIPHHSMRYLLTLLFGTCAVFAQTQPAAPVTTAALDVPTETKKVPTPEELAKKAKQAAILEEKYQALVATLTPDEQAWEKVLQANLGSFYLPYHKRDKLAGKSTAWDFVKDDPALPRVLLIGDSISRGYTLAVRKQLAGKANVHRAPTNCGSSVNGIEKLDIWLGQGKWDVIHFNFGIHDVQKSIPMDTYLKNLELIVGRLKATGAKVVFATTTPIQEDLTKKQNPATAVIERNQAATEIMKKNQVPVDDLFTAITPKLAEYQNVKDVHFKEEGYDYLGKAVAESIVPLLKK